MNKPRIQHLNVKNKQYFQKSFKILIDKPACNDMYLMNE